MVPVISTIIGETFSVLGISLATAYVGLVIMGYTTEGPRYQSGFDLHRAAYSTRRISIGLGIRFLTLIMRITDLILALLFEGAAQVGDWITERSSPETRERYRSRFI